MLKQSFSKMKMVLIIFVAILLALPLTSVLSSAQSNYPGGAYQTYSTDQQPGYITTNEAPAYWDDGVPVFTEPPSGVNTGTIEILNRRRSPGTPEGGSS
jgi:hypothetical protein